MKKPNKLIMYVIPLLILLLVSTITFGGELFVNQKVGAGETSKCCIGTRGDANGDDTINIIDVTFLIDYLYLGGPMPACLEEGNADGDSNELINIIDIVFLIDFLYMGGLVPPDCP